MDVIPQNVHWLIPEENVPCDIFLHFRGQFPLVLAAGQPVTLTILDKLAKANCVHIYHRRGDSDTWNTWANRRHETKFAVRENGGDQEAKFGNKRAELISYLRRSVIKKSEGSPELDYALKIGLEVLMKVVRSPMLDWYFHQFHEPPNLLQHNARVALTAVVFALMHTKSSEEEIESFLFASLIHELEGDPANSISKIASQETLAALASSKRPVPEAVIRHIQFQDELCSGKGFPSNCTKNQIPTLGRIFTLFNHFDHYRLKDAVSRRARFEQARKLMTARQDDYADEFWDAFWAFWEKHMEVV